MTVATAGGTHGADHYNQRERPCASLFYCLSTRISTLEAGIADIGGE